ncbi:MAG: helix-turn-helix domain-containing protein [Pseudomonadota bacterium]|nr:helix-turn-helix domain-containing protein [Pseudomonadota bacterium]
MTTATKPDTDHAKRLKARWSAPLIDAGYTVIPNAILLRQQALGLDSLDLNILLQIASYWWSSEKLPFPSKERIAKAIGIKDKSTVRKRLSALEKGNLIRRITRKNKHGGNDTNVYDLGPLIKAATPYALEMIQEIKAKKEAKVAKLAKKGKPELKAVS